MSKIMMYSILGMKHPNFATALHFCAFVFEFLEKVASQELALVSPAAVLKKRFLIFCANGGSTVVFAIIFFGYFVKFLTNIQAKQIIV